MGSGRDWEKLAAERRMRLRGTESVHDGGYVRLRTAAGQAGTRALRFIEEAKRWKPLEELAASSAAYEDKRRAAKGSGVPLREILDACED